VTADRAPRRGAWVTAGAALVTTLVAAAPVAAAVPSRVSRELRPAAAPGGQLSRTQRVVLPGGAVVHRFQQRVGGRAVLGAQAIVDDGPGAGPRLIADSTKPAIEPPAPARVERAQAIQAASDSVGVATLRGPVSAGLAIRPGHGGTLVWRVLIPAARPLGDFEVLIDAATGAVLAQHDLLEYFRTGRAMLYKVNPVVQHGGAKGLRRDHHDRDTRLLRRLRRRVKLPNINDGQDCMRGRWVHVLRGRKKKETCKRNLHWRKVTRSDNRFEALMAYFQINRAQAYIQSLGYSDSNPSPNGVADRVQVAIADAHMPPLVGQDNSFYSAATRRIMFGKGGVDDAEDGDVIVHEYGHAMQDSQSPAFGESHGFQPGALAEGSSDYWAAVMSALTPRTANEDDVCIFDWDATSYGRFFPAARPYTSGRYCGRRADDKRTLEQAKAQFFCKTEVHCVGQVWSSALWDIREALVARAGRIGGPRMDQVYLAAQFMYTGTEKFKDAARALLCADEDLHPKGAAGDCDGENYAVIHREMRARGILD
jgi:hypothetical protein